jgi:hypothetical protein
MQFIATHIGFLIGDARTASLMPPKVLLRETKRYWITQKGTKYRKNTGRPTAGGAWPLWILDLQSIAPI